ncbi:MAG TPA: aldo/keto reductase [Croceibacterium sp.]|nr:aldo/keto reductase [Croceibacterium sp.]
MDTAFPTGPIPDVALNDGHTLPAIGLGTYTLNGSGGAAAMASAIREGYRLLDAAFNYENEGALGEAIRISGVPRSELVLASKLPGRHHRHAEALATIDESLWRAGLEYYDLYLIHWPNPRQGHYVEAWRALIEARKRGLVQSIGVSNFLPEHIDRLIAETGVVPAVNQIERHPRFQQWGQIAFDRSHSIVTQAWSPLGRGSLLDDPVLSEIATRHDRTVGQIVLRWQVQSGCLPLPKSTSPARQAENLAVFDFELSTNDMTAIAAVDRSDGRLNNQDPAIYEEF